MLKYLILILALLAFFTLLYLGLNWLVTGNVWNKRD